MIKKTMYFKDEKQAKVIGKINDALHKKRDVRVSDVDLIKELKSILIECARHADNIIALSDRYDNISFNGDKSLKSDIKKIAVATKALANKL